jgi:RNA 3'-terminal phosphate cyclase
MDEGVGKKKVSEALSQMSLEFQRSNGHVEVQGGRIAESIGKHVAKQLLEEMQSGATLDRFAADQVIPFAALAEGESRFIIPFTTDHVITNAWLAELFFAAQVQIEGQRMVINGCGFRAKG